MQRKQLCACVSETARLCGKLVVCVPPTDETDGILSPRYAHGAGGSGPESCSGVAAMQVQLRGWQRQRLPDRQQRPEDDSNVTPATSAAAGAYLHHAGACWLPLPPLPRRSNTVRLSFHR